MPDFTFTTTIIEWRGPAPFYYAPLPAEHAEAIRAAAKLVSYGWGMIPVDVTIAENTFYTSLFPRDGTYLIPLKNAVRQPLGLGVGDSVEIALALKLPDL